MPTTSTSQPSRRTASPTETQRTALFTREVAGRMCVLALWETIVPRSSEPSLVRQK